ncbi:MAG: lysophospholipid acyltransferase family protein [Chitinispirillaceae bacterium]
MAEQNRSMKTMEVVRSILILVWVSITVPLIASLVVLASLFNRIWARKIGRGWCKNFVKMAGLRIETVNMDRISTDKRYVLIVNHSSHLDIPIIMSIFPFHVSFIAKKELFQIPFFGWGIAAMGQVSVDRSNARNARKSITKAVEMLKEKDISLVLFPEGTRSPDGKVGDFKQAAFALALESGATVVPIYLGGTHDVLPKKRLLVKPGTITLHIGEPLEPERVGEYNKRTLSEHMHRQIVSMQQNEVSDLCAG